MLGQPPEPAKRRLCAKLLIGGYFYYIFILSLFCSNTTRRVGCEILHIVKRNGRVKLQCRGSVQAVNTVIFEGEKLIESVSTIMAQFL